MTSRSSTVRSERSFIMARRASSRVVNSGWFATGPLGQQAVDAVQADLQLKKVQTQVVAKLVQIAVHRSSAR